jgi:hypothetical protein
MRITFDLLFFAVGLAALGIGLYLIYPPASLIGVGAVLMFVAVWDNGK